MGQSAAHAVVVVPESQEELLGVEVLPPVGVLPPPVVALPDDNEEAPPLATTVDATEERFVLSELPPIEVLLGPSSTPPLDTVCGLPPFEVVPPLERVLFDDLPPAFQLPPGVNVD